MEKWLVVQRGPNSSRCQVLSAFRNSDGHIIVGLDAFRLLDRMDFPSYEFKEYSNQRQFFDDYKIVKRINDNTYKEVSRR